MNALTLKQTSPPSNPDRNVVQVTVSGAYVSGTADPLPLNAIADPQQIGQVPMNNPGQNPPPVTPYLLNVSAPGYSAQVTRTVVNGQTSFGLRWEQASTGAELVTGNYPAAILAAEIFLEILVPLFKQA